MNSRLPPLILAVCAFCPGCELAGNLAHTTAFEVGRYTNECVEKMHEQRLASEAWDHFVCTYGGDAFSKDYGRGFKCGFADYLFAGGTGDPPPFPPLCYWGANYETPDGYAAIQDWFAGYRHGAAAAKESGYRQYVILPMAVPAAAAPPPPPVAAAPPESMPPLVPDESPAAQPELPAPRKLGPSAPQPAPR
jgi:hypothetical protein